MPEENISIFRQELERVKTQFEDKFQDIMASVRADRENDKRTLQMVNENINNDRKAINQNRALNDKLETLLNVQNTMLSELRSMNNSIKDLSGGGGGGMGGMLAAAAAGAGAGFFLNGDGDNNVDGGGGNDRLRYTGGGRNNTRNNNNETRLPNGVANQEIPLEAQAFLNVLTAQGYEGTGTFPNSGYNTIVGGGQFEGYERHPERVGVVTSAGPSTAAGRYQITKTTWNNLRSRYPEILTDFSPENQDLAAWILAQEDYERRSNGRNLLEDLKTEDPEILASIERTLSGTWSSLAGGVHEGSAAGSFSDLIRQNISDLREEESQQREEESDAERVNGDGVTQPLRIDLMKTMARRQPGDTSLRQFGGTKASGEGGLWQQGGQGPHSFDYKSDYSLGTSFEWEELPSNITEGENTITLSDGRVAKFVVSQVGNSFVSSHLVYAEDYTSEAGNDFKAGDPITGLSYNKAENEARALGGDITSLDTLNSIAQQFPTENREAMMTVGGNSSGTEEEAQEMAIRRREAGQSLLPVTQEGQDISGGDGVDDLSGDSGNDNLEPQDTPLGPRIPEETPTEPSEENPTAPTEFPTLAEQFRRGESPTSMAGMDLAPAVEDALRPDLPEPPTEEDPEETTSGGYTGGGGGSREQEQPQIEANAIGRFPWAEKIIKYYNLSDMIKTNMLS